MIRLLAWLFTGHIHKWKTIREVRLEIVGDYLKVPVNGTRYYQQCERCGKVIKRDLA